MNRGKTNSIKSGMSSGKPARRRESGPGQKEADRLLALFAEGQFAAAEVVARAMVLRFPLHGFGWKALGAVLKQMGRTADALPTMQKAATLSAGDAETHFNLGVILQELGRLDEAEAAYRWAIKIKTDYAEALNNLGVSLNDLGRLDEAQASYRSALQIRPDYAEAHNNLGVTFNDLGHLGRAEASYRRALQINRDHADALANLAGRFNAQGDSRLALGSIKRAIQIKETAQAKKIFVDSVKRLRFTQEDSGYRDMMVRALTEPWGRPSDLARGGIDLVKCDPDIGEWVARAQQAWPHRLPARDLFGSNGIDGIAKLASDPLLLALLTSAPVCDIEMERFLTMVRRLMLEDATAEPSSVAEAGSALSFYSALARQCFINEYVFSHTDEEIEKATELRNSLGAALDANAQVPLLWLTAVAAYFPLDSLPLAARLLPAPWPQELASVLVQQLREPAEERRLRATIPRLTGIKDEVSLLVQNQYEENPYPRWVKISSNDKSMAVDAAIRKILPFAAVQPQRKCAYPDILIAGCGTGQHSIGTAERFRGARVLAVDLSMASLCYAKRKTREMGITSIEYAQADILKLGALGRSFDVIESSGVLHHLADPWAGWEVLLSVLRPGGFMRLGFYSEVARRYVVPTRNVIAEKGYGATADEIRRCRQDLLGSAASEQFGTILRSTDFFSTSMCRDLLFHVQEHRLTLTGIEAFLRANGVAFLGFEIDRHVLGTYKLRFPDDRRASDLGRWQIFENENPDTFAGMYQFWIQKPG